MVTQTTRATNVIDCLAQTQSNAVVSYLNYKRYHWYTYGPHFRDLHLFFDELADASFAEVDPFGERVRYLGGDPPSTPAEIERWATIRPSESKGSPRDMLEEALRNERQVIAEMRQAARLAEEAGDYGSNDLYATHVQTHEKYAWFIEEMLRGNDAFGADGRSR